MKLLKPSWVNHDDKPIFSVDIHPAGKRFATGGQGGDSGRVVVWNLNSVLYEHVEMDPNIPKMLCQMDNHLACVNCVRWSNAGKYLASGGDDRLVMVWGLSVAAGAGKHKVETWRCLSTLRGHAGDVLDLAWSPLDKWLASCSVDNTIIIWNAEKFPEMVCVLNGHTGLVKGVAWDPVGKYLASQSDDKSLRVWKTADWAQETIITEPFEECGGTTHVLRLSWSPDGQYVLSAHAMNGGGPTAQVVERDGWRCDKDFVGHRKAVTCARFNNNIFVKEGKKCCCAAVGSRDRALSIWLTSLKRPLVVVHDLFTDSVLDLSWSSDGLNLLACSSDGSVACIQFTNKEIGNPLTMDEKNAFYEKTYGKCLANESGGDLSSNLLVECPEILLAREKQEARKEASKEESTPKSDKTASKPVLTPSPVSNSCPALRPVDRQIETRTSDGKRRITPVFIPLTSADANESLGSQPGAAAGESCFSTSSQSKSRIRVEVRDDIVTHPNVSNHAALLNTSRSSNNGLDQRLRKRTAGTGVLPGPGAEELLPSGKRGRGPPPPAPPTPAAPLPAAPLGAAGPVVRAAGPLRLQVLAAAQRQAGPRPAAARAAHARRAAARRAAGRRRARGQGRRPAAAAGTSCCPAASGAAARRRPRRPRPPRRCPPRRWAPPGPWSGPPARCGCSGKRGRGPPPPAPPTPAAPLPAAPLGAAGPVVRAAGPLRLQVLAAAQRQAGPRPAAARAAHARRAAARRAAGRRRARGQGRRPAAAAGTSCCAAASGAAARRRPRRPRPPARCEKTRSHVVNKAMNTQYGTLARLQLLPNNSVSNEPVWETLLGSAVSCVAVDAKWVCAGCVDGSLHAWRLKAATAERALPPIALPSPASKLWLCGERVCAVTAAAELCAWELAPPACLLRPVCFRALLAHDVTVTNCTLIEDGNPMISLSNGKTYVYCKKLCAWIIWADASDPVWRASGAHAETRAAPHTAHPLHARATHRARRAPLAPSKMSAQAARSWLEAQVSACLHLRLPSDYRHWLTALFLHLLSYGTEEQLRNILDDMLGPSHYTSTPKKWQPTVLGLSKHAMLEEMLSLLVRQLRWQRLYAEYSSQLPRAPTPTTPTAPHCHRRAAQRTLTRRPADPPTHRPAPCPRPAARCQLTIPTTRVVTGFYLERLCTSRR
ncbi:hypothetical protein ACJJTC_008579 [Scirpophaga incertulas]